MAWACLHLGIFIVTLFWGFVGGLWIYALPTHGGLVLVVARLISDGECPLLPPGT